MKTTSDENGGYTLELTPDEYNRISIFAKDDLLSYARQHLFPKNHVYTFYGATALSMALELCRFYGLEVK